MTTIKTEDPEKAFHCRDEADVWLTTVFAVIRSGMDAGVAVNKGDLVLSAYRHRAAMPLPLPTDAPPGPFVPTPFSLKRKQAHERYR
jgi:hypothetical protein